MAEPDPNEPAPKGDDPDAGAKKALDAERKLRRDAEAEAKAEKVKVADLEKRLGDLEGGKKGADEKLTEQIDQLKKDLNEERVKRLKAEVAADKGLTRAQAKRLTGSTLEELEIDADDLLEAFPAPVKGDESGDGNDGETRPATQRRPPASRPAERLKPGTGTDEAPADPTKDIRKLGTSMFEGA